MNKNFEEAYKAEVQQNIPDLWNRIESSLPPKAPVVEVKRKKKNPYAWIKWASLAAACLFMVITVPAVIGVGAFSIFMFGAKSSSDSAAAESQDMAMESADCDGGYTEEYYEYENGVDLPKEEAVEESENDMIMEDSAVSESVTNEESASSGEQQSESYRELLIENMYAKVTEVTETEEGYMYVTLEVSSHSREEADECFSNIAFYNGGELKVKVYEDTGEIPVVGEMYSVTVYDCSPPWQSMIEPCEAVLELYE